MGAPAILLTHAGFPNPHQRHERQPTPIGLPVALGPVGAGTQHESKEAGGTARLQPRALRSAPLLVGCGDALLSEQVLRQKAKIAEAVAAESAAKCMEAEDAAVNKFWAETVEGDQGEEDEEIAGGDLQGRLAALMARVKPCDCTYPVAVAQSTERQRIETCGNKWSYVKGLRVVVKPANEDDCVLLVASCVLTPEADRQASIWAVHRANAVISPRFATHSRQKDCSHFLCMPYLDQPGKRTELDYQVGSTAVGSSTRFVVSGERQRRQLAAVTFSSSQCTWLEDDEGQTVEPGPWRDVAGLYEVITTLPGDKVLVFCTLRYAANWASDLNRGRFTIVRDDVGLDGLHDRGMQSVRARSPDLHRVLLMATIDEPPPGPHVYRVRTAMTAGTESGVTNRIQGDRQLALIRLPGGIVAGPNRVDAPVTVDEAGWTEIPGLSVSVTLRKPRDRIMIVYHTDCNPQSYTYEAHFTIFRRSATGPACNLGFSQEFGLEMVSSDYEASSEYPVGILFDVPGSPGLHTYYVAARVANMGTSTDSPAVVVGYSGSISAVVLSPR